MDEELIYFGGEVKALDDNGKVGGYLVRFTDADAKDLDGDYFTKDTYLGAREGDGVDTLFHHGQPLKFKKNLPQPTLKKLKELAGHIFAPIKTKRDELGIWAETVLDMADEYEALVFDRVKKKKLGWSSGAVSHMVKRAEDGRLERWPIGEASLTPTPAEPKNRALALKSLSDDEQEFLDDEGQAATKTTLLAVKLNQHIEDLTDDGRDRAALISKMASEAGVEIKSVESVLNGESERPSNARLKAFARALDVSYESLLEAAKHDYAQTVKGMFANAVAERTPTRWELESIYSDMLSKMMAAAVAARMAGEEFDWRSKFREVTREYSTLLEEHALSQGESYLESDTNEQFYLKAITDLSSDLSVSGNLDLDDHSLLVVSALREVTKRFHVNHENRVKSGRVLSEKNRTRLSNLLTQMQAVIEDVQTLLDESQPMASDEETRAAKTHFLRLQAARRPLGVQA